MDNTNNTNNAGNMLPHGKRMLWFFIIIGALAILTIGIVAMVSPKQQVVVKDNGKTGNKQANVPTVQTTVKEVSENTTPDFFPKDMPSEPGAEVVKNYNTTATDGRKMGTRVYVTAKTIDANYTIFESYFKKAGWEVSGAPAIKGSDSKTMIATKDKMQAQVTIGSDPVAKAQTVAIIFTQSPN